MTENYPPILAFLNIFRTMGFEVVKSNSGQIALNNCENTMPFVLTNDLEYLTPTPCQWYNIDDEIKRLKGE